MAAALILFSFFFKLDSLLQIANILVGREWSFIMILLVMVLLRMIFAGAAVLIVLPLVLDFKSGAGGCGVICGSTARLCCWGFFHLLFLQPWRR